MQQANSYRILIPGLKPGSEPTSRWESGLCAHMERNKWTSHSCGQDGGPQIRQSITTVFLLSSLYNKQDSGLQTVAFNNKIGSQKENHVNSQGCT